MDINKLIAIITKKVSDQINIQKIEIADKSFLHKNHKGNQEGKYHLKLKVESSWEYLEKLVQAKPQLLI